MSTPEERYIPGASTSYSNEIFCEVCNEVTCDCCRKATTTPCCDQSVCILCILNNASMCCKTCQEIVVKCPLCTKVCAMPNRIVNKYIKHMQISRHEFINKLPVLN
jgi:hypothetical protein